MTSDGSMVVASVIAGCVLGVGLAFAVPSHHPAPAATTGVQTVTVTPCAQTEARTAHLWQRIAVGETRVATLLFEGRHHQAMRVAAHSVPARPKPVECP